MEGRTARRMVGVLRKRLSELSLGKLDDPRDGRRTKWPLAMMLRTVLVGLAAGMKSLAEVEKMTNRMSAPFKQKLWLRGRVPDTTLRDLLVRMEPTSLRTLLYRQVRAASRRKALVPVDLPFGVLSLDGKVTAIDAWDDELAQQQAHGGSAAGAHGLIRTITAILITDRAKVCVDASPIPADTNEDGHFREALDAIVRAYAPLDLFRMVTYDSGACSLANADAVRSHKLHYLFRLDRKQPTLLAEAERVLGALLPWEASAVTEETTRHGLERRYVYKTSEMAAFHGWTHLATVIRVRHETTTSAGKTTAEDRYYLSSLGEDRLSAAQWLRLVRLRWAVENNGHHTFDVPFAEDERPWITADPQGMLAVLLLRRVVYNLLALFRSVTLRSDEHRGMPWKDLLTWVSDAAIAATLAQLEGLRLMPQDAALPA